MTKLAQIEKLIDQLPKQEQIKLTQKLQKRTWKQRLDDMVRKLRKSLTKSMSDDDINAIVEAVRQARYAESRR